MTEWRMVADVGGTNLRAALIAGNSNQIEHLQILRCDMFDTIEAAFAHYLGAQRIVPQSACIAVAGPVTGDVFQFTNNKWRFSARAVAGQFGFDPFHVVNDFEALALSLPRLDRQKLHPIGGHRTPSMDANMVVIGPGTGLGVAGLIRNGKAWLPVPGEGGHISFAPGTSREADILHELWRQVGGRISSERVLSGQGLQNIHRSILALGGQPLRDLSPADIAHAALDASDATCVESLTIFCNIMGSFAGDLALLFMAEGGVFIGGGIPPKILDFLEGTDFRARFEDKGRHRRLMGSIPTYVIMDPYAALLGAAAKLAAPDH